MSRYSKPAGYRTIAQPAGYKIFNNFTSGSKWYAPGAPTGFFSTSYNFVGAPANGSQIIVPDGPLGSPNSVLTTLTFTWGGSPGPGVIPLVAGGGTAAQAAAATALAFEDLITHWLAENPSGSSLTLTQMQQGISTPLTLVGTTNMNAVTGNPVVNGAFVVGRFGKNYAVMPAAPSAEYNENVGGGV